MYLSTEGKTMKLSAKSAEGMHLSNAAFYIFPFHSIPGIFHLKDIGIVELLFSTSMYKSKSVSFRNFSRMRNFAKGKSWNSDAEIDFM